MFDYKRADIQDVCTADFAEMFLLCFGEKITGSYPDWKYRLNPAGEFIAFEATQADRAVGFYAVIPEFYFINGKKTTVYQSVDTMTHPARQKKGLFVTLAEKTFTELFTQSPGSFIIGIPGSNSAHGFINKLHWKPVHTFSYIFLHKRFFQVMNLFRRPVHEVKEINDFDDKAAVEILQDYMNKPVKIKPYIDNKFLKWRITENPNKNYLSAGIYLNEKMLGLVIYYLTPEKNCFVEFMTCLNTNDERQILRSFCTYIFNRHPVRFIYTWKPVAPQKTTNLKMLGFMINPFKKGPFCYKVPFILYSKTGKFDGIDLSDIKNYELQPIIQD